MRGRCTPVLRGAARPRRGRQAAVARGFGWVWFACGAQRLHVGVAEDFAPATKAHPGLRVTDLSALEKLAERLRAAGAPVDPDDRLPGHRRFYTRDPWGNRVELLARV